jgi:hypothetical protein
VNGGGENEQGDDGSEIDSIFNQKFPGFYKKLEWISCQAQIINISSSSKYMHIL